jgi:hypothetical protein
LISVSALVAFAATSSALTNHCRFRRLFSRGNRKKSGGEKFAIWSSMYRNDRQTVLTVKKKYPFLMYGTLVVLLAISPQHCGAMALITAQYF